MTTERQLELVAGYAEDFHSAYPEKDGEDFDFLEDSEAREYLNAMTESDRERLISEALNDSAQSEAIYTLAPACLGEPTLSDAERLTRAFRAALMAGVIADVRRHIDVPLRGVRWITRMPRYVDDYGYAASTAGVA